MDLRMYLITFLIFANSVRAAPRVIRETEPYWYKPCGEDLTTQQTSSENPGNGKIDLFSIQLAYEQIIFKLKGTDYRSLYQNINVAKYQFNPPNWLPNEKDVDSLKASDNATLIVINHLPQLKVAFQKYAVAFEKMIKDEIKTDIKKFLDSIKQSLQQLLCEIESYMGVDYHHNYIERSIMNSTERKAKNETNRLVRDWGIILNFRDYICAWKEHFMVSKHIYKNLCPKKEKK